jgi:hypothetical protein
VNRLYIWGIRGVFIGSQVMVYFLAVYILISPYDKYKASVLALILVTIEAIANVIAILVMCWILMDRSKEIEAGDQEA